MYAVLKSGGKQYKVEEGQVLRLEKLPGDVGSAIKFDQILMIGDGESIQVGQPLVDGASVEARIVDQGRGKKIIVFKYKRRKRYRRKQGHRQEFTAIQVDSILTKTKSAPKKAEPEKPEAKEVKAKKAESKKEDVKKVEPKKAAVPALRQRLSASQWLTPTHFQQVLAKYCIICRLRRHQTPEYRRAFLVWDRGLSAGGKQFLIALLC